MINKVLSRITDEIELETAGVRTVTYLNVYNYTVLRKMPSSLDAFDTITLDGVMLLLYLRIVYAKKLKRMSPDFSSYFKELFDHLNKKKGRVAFIGASEEEIQTFVEIIRSKYPEIDVVYNHSGYNLNAEEVTKSLKSEAVSELFVGMGTPRQELFIGELKKLGYGANSYTCGAFMSQTAVGGETYYPSLVNKFHLRWAYRIYKEPKLIRRYAIDYPKGIMLLLWDSFFVART